MNITIIILLIISFLLFILIAVLIYINRGGEQIISITIKSIMIPILAGAGLMLIEFMQPLKRFNEKIHIGFIDDPKIMHSLDNKTDSQLSEGIFQYWRLLDKVKCDSINNKPALTYDEVKHFTQIYILDILSERNNTHWI